MKSPDFNGNEVLATYDKTTGVGSSVLARKERVWMAVINNPERYNLTIDKIREILSKESENLTYWAAINEISIELNPTTGKPTPHVHVVLYYQGQAYGSHILKLFPHASLQPCTANVPSCVKYIKKDTSGKWFETHPEKLAEKLPPEQAQFTEWGDMPQAKKANTDRIEPQVLLQLIANGSPDVELLALDPSLYTKLQHIRQTRTTLIAEKFAHTFRQLDVTYIFGDTGTGKTRGVMEQYEYNVYRVDDYAHPWDAYAQQDVVIFDEFRQQLDLADMLQWLDGYPCTLRARYANHVACYTKVYIISNWPLGAQYLSSDQRSKDALYRRINHKREYTGYGCYTEYDYNPTTRGWEKIREVTL